MSDPVEARFAVTLAHRDRRVWRWWPLLSMIYVGAGATWLFLLSKAPMTAWTWAEWFLMGSATLGILIYPPLAHRRYRRAVTAERLNRQVVASYDETRS
jgi:amino acid transporter